MIAFSHFSIQSEVNRDDSKDNCEPKHWYLVKLQKDYKAYLDQIVRYFECSIISTDDCLSSYRKKTFVVHFFLSLKVAFKNSDLNEESQLFKTRLHSNLYETV